MRFGGTAVEECLNGGDVFGDIGIQRKSGGFYR
jgi:hypothetical protein